MTNEAITLRPSNCGQSQPFESSKSEIKMAPKIAYKKGQVVAEATIDKPCPHHLDGAELSIGLDTLGNVCTQSCLAHCVFNSLTHF